MDTVEDDSLLSQMKEETVATSDQPISTCTNSSRGRKQRNRLERKDNSVLYELRDTMKTSTEFLSELVDLHRASSTQKPFIANVSQTVRDLLEAEYPVMKKITTLLLNSQDPVEVHPFQFRNAPTASSISSVVMRCSHVTITSVLCVILKETSIFIIYHPVVPIH